MRSSHFLNVGVNWASPMLLASIIGIYVSIMKRYANDMISKWGFGMASKKMQVDEDLPQFYSVTTLPQRKQMCTMYNNMKNNFGFEYTDPDVIDELEKADYPFRTITGTPWYNVMSNPAYCNEFNFVPSHVSEREKILDDGYPNPPEQPNEADFVDNVSY